MKKEVELEEGYHPMKSVASMIVAILVAGSLIVGLLGLGATIIAPLEVDGKTMLESR